MNNLTPLDIENASFKVTLRGYDQREVEQFRGAVLSTITSFVDLLGQYRTRIGELENQLKHYKDSEELLKSSMLLAQKTGDDVAYASRQKADVLIAQAQLEAQAIRANFAAVEAERERFEFEFHGLLRGFMERLEQRNPVLSTLNAPAAQAAPAQLDPLATAVLVEPTTHAGVAPPSLVAEPLVLRSPVQQPALSLASERDLDADDFASAVGEARPAEPLQEVHSASSLFVPQPSVLADTPFEAVESADEGDEPAGMQAEQPELAEAEHEASETDDPGSFDWDDEPLPAAQYKVTEDEETEQEDATAAAAVEAPASAPASSSIKLPVHPVNDDEDEDEDSPRVRRTGRW